MTALASDYGLRTFAACIVAVLVGLYGLFDADAPSNLLVVNALALGLAVPLFFIVRRLDWQPLWLAAPLLALQGASERTGGGMRVDKIAACNWHAISAAISMQSASMWEVRTRSQLVRLGASASTARFQSPISEPARFQSPISNLGASASTASRVPEGALE